MQTNSDLQPLHAAKSSLDSASSSVITTLAYFSVFRHPLNQEELATFGQFCAPLGKDQDWVLGELVDLGLVECQNGFYFLAGQADLVPLRITRNWRARRWLERLDFSSRLLAYLPFMQAFALSGSLSKGTQDLGGDIDFFALTVPGRVWTAQFFLTLLIKAMPKMRRKCLCVNFLLAADQLAIRRRNLFTATEIAFLRPLSNGPLWTDFFAANRWVGEFYPNWTPPSEVAGTGPMAWGKHLLEWSFGGRFGDWFEARFFNWLTARRFRHPVVQDPKDRPRGRLMVPNAYGHTRTFEHYLQGQVEAALDRFEAEHGVTVARWNWNLEERRRRRHRSRLA
jgi:hypothetical protein